MKKEKPQMELIKKTLPYIIIIIPGVFLEFWIYTFSNLLSIKDFLFDQSIAWGRFFAFMTVGNIFLATFCYVVAKRVEKLAKTKINYAVTIALIWITSFVVTAFFYSR
ncbi:hypothetical protein KKB83_02665 [Patescibacteria group bacterium]|nr:hypothetical protein [Patescibacteria group bacterium]